MSICLSVCLSVSEFVSVSKIAQEVVKDFNEIFFIDRVSTDEKSVVIRILS